MPSAFLGYVNNFTLERGILPGRCRTWWSILHTPAKLWGWVDMSQTNVGKTSTSVSLRLVGIDMLKQHYFVIEED